jgi:hypothetical protein
MPFEHHTQPLLNTSAFALRLLKYVGISAGMIGVALVMGASGYHYIEGLSWIDSVLNASMLLGGMGPVSELHTNTGKLFASGYALFSGLLFVSMAGLVMAPVLHRLLHKFHLEEEEKSD